MLHSGGLRTRQVVSCNTNTLVFITNLGFFFLLKTIAHIIPVGRTHAGRQRILVAQGQNSPLKEDPSQINGRKTSPQMKKRENTYKEGRYQIIIYFADIVEAFNVIFSSDSVAVGIQRSTTMLYRSLHCWRMVCARGAIGKNK